MALKDLKSNLAKGAGKPKGSPDGNIPNESRFDKFLDANVGKVRGKLIDSETPEILKYRDFTANGKKA
tara:strand:+ start:365 stop:568 length:204 start_codon:yes stop_codon:yes gene_type:complete